MPRRRDVLRTTAAALLTAPARRVKAATLVPRVRPGEPGWPADAVWAELNAATGGRLSVPRSPLPTCPGSACDAFFRAMKNPYFIGDDPALTQTTGWIDAWTSRPSAYVVAAETAAEVAAAVNFAREHNVRLVVKGGGHSYLGTSCAPDSLLIWTRRMRDITMHDAFVPRGCAGATPVPAVSLGPGAIWHQAYDAVTTKGGRYVQGGGCLTVGVAGLVLGGGFGSYSKMFGTAAASLLEAEVVTADGAIRIANACGEPDLFWALRGGGGGTFGVVTRITLRTHDLPPTIGTVRARVRATSEDAFRRLLGRFVAFYADALLTPNWGEIVNVRSNVLDIALEFIGIDRTRAEAIWRPFFDWVESDPDVGYAGPTVIRDAASRDRWNPAFFARVAPEAMRHDDRPGAPAGNVYWAGNVAEAGHFIHGYESVWLPRALLRSDQRQRLADALFATSRIWPIELHFQKGLAGAPPGVIAATGETATNPAVLEAFVLAIIGSEGPPAWPGVPGHEPNVGNARHDAERVRAAMAKLREVVPGPAAYVAESSFFEADWRAAYWGENYPRLLAVKQRYDPDGRFFAHHGVGSEFWRDDGFNPR